MNATKQQIANHYAEVLCQAREAAELKDAEAVLNQLDNSTTEQRRKEFLSVAREIALFGAGRMP